MSGDIASQGRTREHLTGLCAMAGGEDDRSDDDASSAFGARRLRTTTGLEPPLEEPSTTVSGEMGEAGLEAACVLEAQLSTR